jgi:hypothetical protein
VRHVGHCEKLPASHDEEWNIYRHRRNLAHNCLTRVWRAWNTARSCQKAEIHHQRKPHEEFRARQGDHFTPFGWMCASIYEYAQLFMDAGKHLTRGSIFWTIPSSSSSFAKMCTAAAAAAAPSLQRAYLHDALHRDTHGVLRLIYYASSSTTTTNDTNSSSRRRVARVGCPRDDGESREVLPEMTPQCVS